FSIPTCQLFLGLFELGRQILDGRTPVLALLLEFVPPHLGGSFGGVVFFLPNVSLFPFLIQVLFKLPCYWLVLFSFSPPDLLIVGPQILNLVSKGLHLAIVEGSIDGECKTQDRGKPGQNSNEGTIFLEKFNK